MDIQNSVIDLLLNNISDLEKQIKNYEVLKYQRQLDIPALVDKAEIKKQELIDTMPERLDKAESKLIMAKIISSDFRSLWAAEKGVADVINTEEIWNEKIEEIKKSYQEWDSIINGFLSEIKDITDVAKRLNMLEFTTKNVPYDCLSPYHTYCNRYQFYYTDELLKYSPKQIIEIVLCEFFNSLQNYFIKGKFTGSSEVFRGISLLMMRSINYIKEEIPYAQSIRAQLMTKIKEKFPKLDIISFGPNYNAAEALFKTMLYDDSEQRIAKIEKLPSKYNIECYYVVPYYYFPRMSGLDITNTSRYEGQTQAYYENETEIIFIRNGKRVTKGSADVKNYVDWAQYSGHLKKFG